MKDKLLRYRRGNFRVMARPAPAPWKFFYDVQEFKEAAGWVKVGTSFDYCGNARAKVRELVNASY